MKKSIIIIVCVILVLTSVLAGTALAAKPDDKPIDEWDLIPEIWEMLQAVSGNISDMLGQLGTLIMGVENVDNKIDNLNDDVAAVASNVTPIYESLGSMASVNSTQGHFTFTGSQSGAFAGTGNYIGGAHHSITVHILAIGIEDRVEIWEYYKSDGDQLLIVPVVTYLCTGRYTYETNAYRVAIFASNDVDGPATVDLKMAWGVTTTYSADSVGY